MSAKGLPPAVRLDLLLPLSHPSSQQSPSHHSSEGGARPFRPPPSSSPYVVPEAPKSMSRTPPISNNQVVHVKPRGLTPIIITPSSSRAHTPVQLLPLPPALVFPQPDLTMLGKPEVKKLKISPKLEPVNLEPLLPTKKEVPCRAMAVVDDDEVERAEERIHVRRDRNDQSNQQLPTPQTTPLAQALDTIHDNDRHNCDCGSDKGKSGESNLRYTSTHTGKTVSFAPLLLDSVRPISLDPEARPPVDPYHPERVPARERDVERGRKRERGPSRFRNHERHRHRPAPYDLKSRPASSKDSQESSKASEKCNPRVYTGQLKLGDIAAAAALVMNEADQVNSSSGSTDSSSTGHSVSSDSVPTSSAFATTTTGPTPILALSSCSATTLAQQSAMPTPTPTPPHHHHNSAQQMVDHQHPIKGDLDPHSRPSRAIHEAADEMMQLFTNEFHSRMARERELMQEHLSRERQQLFADVQREREALERARADLQREREMLRGEVVKELCEENEALKARIRQLQAALDVVQGGRP
ncbi:hypothetical protein NP233_g3524 [Leucocoprinus birnbaumii]|uniref:Uncharacterized protein n=1 Tax=Leucocoprinus birnbaumii TaxID=56174 RepID=A0AAD5VWF8_9AGAR|nr:hypothetical protein NP233_g3524 [Leucocoprinus birnbaumii]